MTSPLFDPIIYSSNTFWDVLADLRRNDPVHRGEDPDGRPFWALTRYTDIQRVYADQHSYTSREGMNLGSDAAAVEAVRDRMLIVTDAPAHPRIKRVLMRAFTNERMNLVKRAVSDVVQDLVSEAVESGGCDIVDVVRALPNHVICALMGLPRQDWDWLGHRTTEAFEATDRAVAAAANAEIFLYFMDVLEHRRRTPVDDIISIIAATGDDTTSSLSDEEVVFNAVGILSGANETTRYAGAGGVNVFAQHPDIWRDVRAAGVEGNRLVVEEILRWTTPGIHAMRTAIALTTVGGFRIEPGDRVSLWNASANRDETVFDEPDTFVWNRTPNRHISFGHGRHLCLGSRLARLELSLFIGTLAQQVEAFVPAGSVAFNSSNFTWGVTSLPVRFQAAPGLKRNTR